MAINVFTWRITTKIVHLFFHLRNFLWLAIRVFFFDNYTYCDVNIQISYIYIFKIEIRNTKIYSSEVSVTSTMASSWVLQCFGSMIHIHHISFLFTAARHTPWQSASQSPPLLSLLHTAESTAPLSKPCLHDSIWVLRCWYYSETTGPNHIHCCRYNTSSFPILFGNCLLGTELFQSHSGLSLAWDYFHDVIANPCSDWRSRGQRCQSLRDSLNFVKHC